MPLTVTHANRRNRACGFGGNMRYKTDPPGRTIYDNIVKFVRFQLSTNIGAILTVLGAPLFGLATPFTGL